MCTGCFALATHKFQDILKPLGKFEQRQQWPQTSPEHRGEIQHHACSQPLPPPGFFCYIYIYIFTVHFRFGDQTHVGQVRFFFSKKKSNCAFVGGKKIKKNHFRFFFSIFFFCGRAGSKKKEIMFSSHRFNSKKLFL